MQPATETSKIELSVTYNGVPKPLSAEPHETIQSVLTRAIALFGITDRPHLLSLFLNGVELQGNESVAQAGLKSGDKLQLRPSAVKGG